MSTSYHAPLYVVMGLLMSACQMGPDKQGDVSDLVQSPAAWSAPSGAESISDRWWESFDDEQLNALIQEALHASPSLASAGARVDAALANLQAVTGLDDPQVTAGLNLSRRRQNFIGLPIPGSGVATSTSNNFGLSLNASWEIDLWGRLAAGERAVAANFEATLADLSAAQLALTGAVARSYFSLVESKLAVEIAEDQVSNAQDALGQSERLQQQGRGSLQAVLGNRVALSNARANAVMQRQRVAQLEPSLAALVGRSSGPIEVNLVGFERQALSATPDAGLPAQLLSRRADLAALASRADAALAQTQMAHAALFPQISLSASAGTSSDDLANLLDGDFGVWSLGSNILAPLFNGGRLRAQENQAAANHNAALFAFASQALVAFAEVESALNNEGLLRQRLIELQDLQSSTGAIENTALRHHERGVGPASAVYTARINRLNARSSLLAARSLIYSNRIALIAALGGGFTSSDQVASTASDSPQTSNGENAL